MTGEGGGKIKKRSREAIKTGPADVNRGEDDLDLNLSSDIKGIISALQQIRDKAQKDGQKRTEEIINGVSSEVKSILDEAKLKCEKERQNFIKAATKTCKECENALKSESVKFQCAYDKFCKEKASHLQNYKGKENNMTRITIFGCLEIFSKFEDEKEKLLIRYEQQSKKHTCLFVPLFELASKTAVDGTEYINGLHAPILWLIFTGKKEKSALLDLQKVCGDKITAAEDSLKKKKQFCITGMVKDDKSFSILRKSLGSFLESASDEDDLDE
eukprot:Gb_23674 [translate_table: standard]